MNNTTRTYDISNEQLLLINILNTMYNDNLRQITNLTSSNIEIRNLIINILNTNNNTTRNNNATRNNTNNNYNYNNRINNQRNIFRDNNITNEILSRLYVNTTPYIIDSVEQIRIPVDRNYRNLSLNNNDYLRLLRNFLDPVEVYPTQSQIETATRRVMYCDIISPKNTSCPISLNSFNDNDMVTVIRHCGHIFNSDELNTWFTSHCNCPVCRYDIREDNSNVSSAFSSENQNNSNTSSSQPSSQNNNTQNNSLNSNTERNQSIFNNLVETIFNDYGEDILNNLNYTDASGNGELSEPFTLFRQLNNRNHPSI